LDPALDNPDKAADALDRWILTISPAGLPPLVLVDELDGMLARFDVRFFERLRGMLGYIALVVATRIEIDLIYKKLGLNSPFENRLQLEPLGLLESQAVEELVAWGRPPIDAREAALLPEWAGRHPFFLQLLGRHLVDARHHHGTVDDALMRFQFEAAARLREMWRELDEAEREALRQSVMGKPIWRNRLKQRGIATSEGAPFGRVLIEWLREFSD
jgi:hypothetical protein